MPKTPSASAIPLYTPEPIDFNVVFMVFKPSTKGCSPTSIKDCVKVLPCDRLFEISPNKLLACLLNVPKSPLILP